MSITETVFGVIHNKLADCAGRPRDEQAGLITGALLAANLLAGSAPPTPPRGCICPVGAEATCRRGDCGRGAVHG